jgi:hypothetical protein
LYTFTLIIDKLQFNFCRDIKDSMGQTSASGGRFPLFIIFMCRRRIYSGMGSICEKNIKAEFGRKTLSGLAENVF